MAKMDRTMQMVDSLTKKISPGGATSAVKRLNESPVKNLLVKNITTCMIFNIKLQNRHCLS
jgi:hypothetical protein